MIFFTVNLGFIAVLVFLFLAIIGGAADEIVHYMSSHISTIVLICIIVIAAVFFLSYFTTKKWRTSFFSIIYTSQFCYFVAYGMYCLGAMRSEHPIKCIFLFFCYAFYGFLNGLELLIAMLAGADDYEDFAVKLTSVDWRLIIFGVVGWIVNVIVF